MVPNACSKAIFLCDRKKLWLRLAVGPMRGMRRRQLSRNPPVIPPVIEVRGDECCAIILAPGTVHGERDDRVVRVTDCLPEVDACRVPSLKP